MVATSVPSTVELSLTPEQQSLLADEVARTGATPGATGEGLRSPVFLQSHWRPKAAASGTPDHGLHSFAG